MPKLLLIDNGKAQHVQMGQELTMGRAYSNLLRLDGEEISRVHAIIYRRGADYIIRDLDSKNGVLLNGQKVANALLGTGDEIQLGPHLLVFEPPATFDLQGFLKNHDAVLEGEVVTEPLANDMESSFVFARTPETPLNIKAAERNEETNPGEVFFGPDQMQAMLVAQIDSPAPGTANLFLKVLAGLQANVDVSPSETANHTQLVLQSIVEAVEADRGVVVFKSAADSALNLAAIVPLDKDVAVNRVVMRTVLKEGRGVLCNDAQKDSRFSATETVRKDRIGCMVACPIIQGDEAVGLIYIDAIGRTNLFHPEHLLLLQFGAVLVAMLNAPAKVAGPS